MTTTAQPSMLSRTAQLFAGQARLYCLSALIAGAVGIASLIIVSVLMIRGGAELGWDPVAIWKSMTYSHQILSILGMLLAFWTPILLAARGTCRITTEQLAAKSVSLSNVISDMARFIPAALIYSLVIGVTAMIGFSILVIPGIVIASLFVLVIPTSVNESSGIIAAFRRGVSLGYRVWNKALVLTFVSGVLVLVIIVVRNIFLDRFLLSPGTSLAIIRLALAYIPALLVLVLANISFTLLYHDSRVAEAPAATGNSSAPQP